VFKKKVAEVNLPLRLWRFALLTGLLPTEKIKAYKSPVKFKFNWLAQYNIKAKWEM